MGLSRVLFTLTLLYVFAFPKWALAQDILSYRNLYLLELHEGEFANLDTLNNHITLYQRKGDIDSIQWRRVVLKIATDTFKIISNDVIQDIQPILTSRKCKHEFCINDARLFLGTYEEKKIEEYRLENHHIDSTTFHNTVYIINRRTDWKIQSQDIDRTFFEDTAMIKPTYLKDLRKYIKQTFNDSIIKDLTDSILYPIKNPSKKLVRSTTEILHKNLLDTTNIGNSYSFLTENINTTPEPELILFKGFNNYNSNGYGWNIYHWQEGICAPQIRIYIVNKKKWELLHEIDLRDSFSEGLLQQFGTVKLQAFKEPLILLNWLLINDQYINSYLFITKSLKKDNHVMRLNQ